MNTVKRIAWKSWNAIEEVLCYEPQLDMGNIDDIDDEDDMEAMSPEMPFPFFPIIETTPKLLHTPLGLYPADSMFKPSDRWDCWIGLTNFSITNSIKDVLKNDVEGVEALKILGRYTFFVGVAGLFDFKDVRKDIESKLCDYTEQEVLSDKETQLTVDLVKKQLTKSKYWSILVAPSGKVDYVVSESLDEKYLSGLNELLELKQNLGGIILRGDHG
tara:strand:+ start:9337 stop:9984 length:648 start_codon:yes stop_codon:yes gene_type:complete